MCQKCGQLMDSKQFYTYKDGRKTEMCKKCLTMHVDCFNPDTYTWLLEKMDVPYVPEEWDKLVNKDFEKDPNKLNGTAILGKYLSKMRLTQWKKFTWKDSQEILENQKEERQRKLDIQRRLEAKIQDQYDSGEIGESEYKTLMSTEAQYNNLMAAAPNPSLAIGQNNYFNEENFIDKDKLPDPAADLTDEDKIYLAMKWGRLYKPSEWIELEKKYEEMMNSFDIQDSDTIGTLILICKTYLKLNQAIDCGDLDGYQKLSRTYDTLRKSAKFTAAQNKEAKSDFVDSVGQMVAYCEKEGGKIPKFEIKEDLDIVDKIIRDLKDYNKTLIYEDTALARQIEEYLKKKEVAEDIKREKELAKKKNEDYEMKDEDIHEYNNIIKEEKEKDFKLMYGKE